MSQITDLFGEWLAAHATPDQIDSYNQFYERRIAPALSTPPVGAETGEPGEDKLWQDIATAPKDGTAFQARIPGHGSDNIIAWSDGLMNEAGDDCGGWQFVKDQEPPDDWTDGVCWAVNENGVPSTAPTHWKPLPASLVSQEAGE